MRENKLPRLAAVAAVVCAAVAAGCDGDSGFQPVRLQVRVSAEPTSIPADGTSTITAQVTNNRGENASGIPIEWGNSLAALQVRNSVTDANGRATAALSGQGARGVAVVTAGVVGLTERAQVEVRIGLD